ncbi:MAG: phosphatidate cytidylyltransferase [Sphingobacteriaceae bacterium]|nr:phosphatidate cytidylyltransferase [Sphingobacteriaceae bacterium]
MNNLLHQIDSNVLSFILILFSVLSFASALFFVWGKLKPEANLKELKTRCKSWWIMSTVFLIATVFSTKISYVAFALLSFVALRELLTILKLRQEDRSAMLLCYLAIPIQYFFTYQGYLIASLVFIPVFMFVALPFRLVLVGQTEGIIQSMAVIPATLMIALFGLSHLGLLLSIPGGRGLLFFLVFIVEMNDVFQFVWGKLLGKHKILPKVSPNKTWEGFIGGVLSTTVLGFALKFLTPCTTSQIIIISFLTANAGFIGDVIISSVKRDLHLKDTSTAIPGHGGVLDRIDSLVVAVPVFFHLVYFFTK